MSWYIVLSKPNQEAIALRNLARQNLGELYRPQFRQLGKIRSLFPNYIFLGSPETPRLSTIRGTNGCRGLLCAGEYPATIRNQEIDDLRNRHTSEGLISLCQFELGDPIIWGIVPGQFINMVDEERIMILYSMLGREHRKVVPLSSVCSAVPA